MPAVLRPWLLVVLALALFSLLLDTFATRQRRLGPARSLRTLDESTATDNASHPLASTTQALHGVRTREEASQKVEEASIRTDETNTSCFEIDQGSGLKLPCFWIVPKGLDLEMHKPQAGGEPTILLLVSSYRDFQCRETIAYAFSRAAHPLRLHAAVVDQVGQTPVVRHAIPSEPERTGHVGWQERHPVRRSASSLRRRRFPATLPSCGSSSHVSRGCSTWDGPYFCTAFESSLVPRGGICAAGKSAWLSEQCTPMSHVWCDRVHSTNGQRRWILMSSSFVAGMTTSSSSGRPQGMSTPYSPPT